jgi:hypothetical protein
MFGFVYGREEEKEKEALQPLFIGGKEVCVWKERCHSSVIHYVHNFVTL